LVVAETSQYAVDGGEVRLTGADLAEFLAAVLGRRKPFRFVAHGASMYPFIRDGDAVTVGPLPAAGSLVGDVVAFRQPDGAGLVIHRVVARHGDRCLLRGDNTVAADGFVAESDILGVVVAVERRGRAVRSHRRLGPAAAGLSRRGWLRPLVAVTRRAAGCVRRRA